MHPCSSSFPSFFSCNHRRGRKALKSHVAWVFIVIVINIVTNHTTVVHNTANPMSPSRRRVVFAMGLFVKVGTVIRSRRSKITAAAAPWERKEKIDGGGGVCFDGCVDCRRLQSSLSLLYYPFTTAIGRSLITFLDIPAAWQVLTTSLTSL